MLVSVFVVGNVSAATEKKVTYGEVNDITATDGRYYHEEDVVESEKNSSDKNKTVVITYNEASLKYLGRQQDLNGLDRGKDAAWIGFRVEKLDVNGTKATLKSATLNGSDFYIPESTSGLVTLPNYNGTTNANQYDIWTPVTVEDIQKAVLGNGVYSATYVLTWEVGDEDNKTTYNQTITINVKAEEVTITDLRTNSETSGKELWNEDKVENYKLKNPVTPAGTEETGNTTGTNGAQDDVPPTNDVMTMALVGTIEIRYRPNVSQRIRRRQRKRRNN